MRLRDGIYYLIFARFRQKQFINFHRKCMYTSGIAVAKSHANCYFILLPCLTGVLQPVDNIRRRVHNCFVDSTWTEWRLQ